MSKLLNAQLGRMYKSKEFVICLAACYLLAAAAMLNYGLNANINNKVSLENYLFNFIPFFSVFPAIFTSLFIGTEHSDGTMRNKIIVGATRQSIFFTNMSVSCIAAVAFTIAEISGALMVGIPFFGSFSVGIGYIATYVGVIILANTVLGIMYSVIAMLFTNKALSAVLTIMLFFGLLILGSTIYNKLLEPEITSGFVFIDGALEMTEPAPNPAYVGGGKREFLQLLFDVLPTGQLVQVADAAITSPVRIVIGSLALGTITAVGGAFAFSKKDLK